MNALIAATPRSQADTCRRTTRYAIECVIDGQTTVIGFSIHQSRAALLKAARAQAAAILPFVSDTDACTYRAGVLTLGARVSLRFGDTERRNR